MPKHFKLRVLSWIMLLCFVTAVMPAVKTVAAAEIIYINTFDDGTYSNLKSYLSNLGSPVPTPGSYALFGIAQIDDNLALVLDNSELAGTPYPQKSENDVCYPQVDFEKSITQTELIDNTYYIEKKIRFENSFALSSLIARFGSSNWVNGVTNDERIYSIDGNGRFTFNRSSFSTQLELDTWYNVGILLDFTGAVPIKSLYFNRTLVSQTEGTQIVGGGGEGEDANTIYKFMFRSYPNTGGERPGEHKDTVLAIDNIMGFKGNPLLDVRTGVVTGIQEIYIPKNTASFKYTLTDDLYEKHESMWSVSPESDSVYFDGDLLIVLPTAAAGTYTVNAVSQSNPLLTASKTLTVNPVSYAFFGANYVAKPIADVKAVNNYYVMDNLGDIHDAYWSVDGTPTGILLTDEGNLILANNTPNQTIKLRAVSKTNNLFALEKSVTISNGRAFNFENDTVNAKPAAFDSSRPALVAEENNGNKYLNATNNTNHARVYFPSEITRLDGIVSVEWDTKIESSDSGGYSLAVASTAGEWIVMYQYRNISESSIYSISMDRTGDVSNQQNLKQFPSGTWHKARLVMDFDNRLQSFYVNDELLVDGYSLRNDAHPNQTYNLNGLIFGAQVDNIHIYSGKKVERKIHIETPDSVSRPYSGDTVLMLNAEVTEDGAPVSEIISWTLKEDYEGIRIEGEKVFISDTDLVSFTITASAYSGEIFAEKVINLHNPVYFDFEDETEGQKPSFFALSTTATVAVEGTNKYLRADGKTATLNMTDFGGRTVVQALIRKESAAESSVRLGGLAEVKFVGENSKVKVYVEGSPQNYAIFDLGDWIEFHATADNGLITVIVDNQCIAYEAEAENSNFDYFYCETDLDNLIIASSYTKRPYAVNPKIEGFAASDQMVTAVFDFYAVDYETKTNSHINWYVSEGLHSAYTKVAEGEDYKIAPEHVGKYLKFDVTVSSRSGQSRKSEAQPVLINQALEAEVTGANLSVTVNNIWGTEKAFILSAVLYKEGQVSDVIALSGSVFGQQAMMDIALGATSDFDEIHISLLNKETLSPLCAAVNLGVLSSGNKSMVKIPTQGNNLYSVILLNPKSTADIVTAFESAYTVSDFENLVKSTQTSVKSIVADIKVFSGQDGLSQVELSASQNGLYNVVYVRENSQTKNNVIHTKGIETLFAHNAVTNLSKNNFTNVLKVITGTQDNYIETIYNTYFMALTQKQKVADYIASNGYDLNLFYVATLMQAIVQGVGDQTAAAELLEIFSSDVQSETSLELYKKVSDKAGVSTKLSTYNIANEQQFFELLFVHSILEGVRSVSHYKNAGDFVMKLGNARYDNGDITLKNAVLLAVAGKTFPRIEALNDAINTVTVTSGSPSGGGGGGASSGKTTSGSYNADIAPVYPEEFSGSNVQFNDVKAEHWGYHEIMYMFRKGIISGDSDKNFRPDESITRAEFLKILCHVFGIKEQVETVFGDVDRADWFSGYVAGAYQKQLIKGYNNMFYPNNMLTREDAAVMVYNFAVGSGFAFEIPADNFEDKDDIAEYANEAVGALASTGIINGIGGNRFAPKSSLTRASAVKLLYEISMKGGKN